MKATDDTCAYVYVWPGLSEDPTRPPFVQLRSPPCGTGGPTARAGPPPPTDRRPGRPRRTNPAPAPNEPGARAERTRRPRRTNPAPRAERTRACRFGPPSCGFVRHPTRGREAGPQTDPRPISDCATRTPGGRPRQRPDRWIGEREVTIIQGCPHGHYYRTPPLPSETRGPGRDGLHWGSRIGRDSGGVLHMPRGWGRTRLARDCAGISLGLAILVAGRRRGRGAVARGRCGPQGPLREVPGLPLGRGQEGRARPDPSQDGPGRRRRRPGDRARSGRRESARREARGRRDAAERPARGRRDRRGPRVGGVGGDL